MAENKKQKNDKIIPKKVDDNDNDNDTETLIEKADGNSIMNFLSDHKVFLIFAVSLVLVSIFAAVIYFKSKEKGDDGNVEELKSINDKLRKNCEELQTNNTSVNTNFQELKSRYEQLANEYKKLENIYTSQMVNQQMANQQMANKQMANQQKKVVNSQPEFNNTEQKEEKNEESDDDDNDTDQDDIDIDIDEIMKDNELSD